jgi:hypothetical protein
MSQPEPLPPFEPQPVQPRPYRRSSGFWGGAILILIGLYFLLSNLGFLWWLSFDIVWPVVLIGIGVYLVFRRLR